MTERLWDALAGGIAGTWDWLSDHTIDIVMFLFLAACAVSVIWISQKSATDHRQQVDLCVRAFEYSRDQCEFIVSNHVMVNR